MLRSTGEKTVSIRSYTSDATPVWKQDLPLFADRVVLAQDEQGNVAIAAETATAVLPGDTEAGAIDKPLWVGKWNAAGALVMSVVVLWLRLAGI